MKSIKTLSAMLCMLALSFSSCVDDKDNDEPSDTSIVGHWLQVYDVPHLGTIGFGYTFEANGTGYMEANVVSDEDLDTYESGDLQYQRYDFTYKCEKGKLKLNSSSQPILNYLNLSYRVKDNTLYLMSKDEDGEDGTDEFKKYPTSLKEILGL
ncbi:MAG: hypothetical protein NC453_30255 [Muribaculum sp.]|nr:hypothetical protein [Muribaculum sp.]